MMPDSAHITHLKESTFGNTSQRGHGKDSPCAEGGASSHGRNSGFSNYLVAPFCNKISSPLRPDPFVSLLRLSCLSRELEASPSLIPECLKQLSAEQAFIRLLETISLEMLVTPLHIQLTIFVLHGTLPTLISLNRVYLQFFSPSSPRCLEVVQGLTWLLLWRNLFCSL